MMTVTTRRILQRTGYVLLALLLLAAAAAGIQIWRMLPPTSGSIALPGLVAPVAVGRDAGNVVHIRAESSRDAWFSLGYMHAQERGWQLEFNRRLMHGTLSEVLGPATLEVDKLIRTLGIMQAAHQQMQDLPPDVLTVLQAYSDGVAAFRTHGRQASPPEFTLLGVAPGGWDPIDSVAWTLMMALDLGGNWGTEFARLSAAAVLDNTMLWQLFPPYEGETPASEIDLPAFYRELGVYLPQATRVSETPAINAFGDHAQAAWHRSFVADLGSPGGKGSNNWAVTGERSATGLPLLANDPHLELSAPAIWYVASLEAPDLKVAGATIPGLPFVVLGRTEGAAWTFTNTGPDVQDLYLEQLHPEDPDRYLTPDGWASFNTRNETIKVKGDDDVTIEVRQSRHGPVLSDIQASHASLLDRTRYVLALRWSALEPGNRTVVAGVRMNLANTVDELIEAGAAHHSPMQSVIMADTTGRVALKVMGRAPLRHAENDLNGVAPAPGWEERYDWAGWIPYEDNPQELAPSGWVATANQRVQTADYPHFLGQEWHPSYRYQRIAHLLDATQRHDLDTFAAIQGDVVSLAALRLLPHARAAADRLVAADPSSTRARQARDALAAFDGQMAADQAAPLIFVAWADHLTRRVLEPRIGAERLSAWYGGRHFRRTLEMILEDDLAAWCAPLNCAEHSQLAMAEALQALADRHGGNPEAWRWGTAHPAISVHRPLGEVELLARWFNVQVPSAGDHFTINVGQYRATGETPYANRQAASLRLLFDLADLDQSRFIYQTGQSGLVVSQRYRDMRHEWAAMQYRPLDTSPDSLTEQILLVP
ncbi:MAG: penicillin acylase family protein [Pigmentiphaga sp.]